MRKFKYQVEVPASSQSEADEKMQLALAIVNKLDIEETRKVKQIINTPAKFAMIKQYLG
jgi:hypothetical protein